MKGKTFFLSFVEECVLNPNPKWAGFIGGRVEVYEIGGPGQYAIEEIRFLTKKQKEYHKLRAKWDFEDATLRQLNRLKKDISSLNGKEKE